MATDGKLVPVGEKLKTVADLLEKYKGAMVKSAPRFFNVERALMVARLAVSRQPKLLEADPLTLVAAVAYGAQLGLEPCGAGGIHLVPFWNSRRGRLEIQPITDYRALVELARRSGRVTTFDAQIVCEKDQFKYQRGTKPFLVHVPAEEPRGEPIAVYAIAKLTSGDYQFEVMTRTQIEAHRDRFSKAAKEGPWVTDPEPMFRKTPTRQLCKWLPQTPEIQRVIQTEEQAEIGQPEDLTGLLGNDLGAPPRETKIDKLTQKLKEGKDTGQGATPSPLPIQDSPATETVRDPGTVVEVQVLAAQAVGSVGVHPSPTADPQVEGVRQPVTSTPPAPAGAGGGQPIDRDALLKEIAVAMRQLKLKPDEEQYLWGKYGAQGKKIPTEKLTELRDYLSSLETKMAEKRQNGRR